MSNKKSIEEQVAELTEKQKDTVVKVGIWGSVILAVCTIPALIFFVLGSITMITSPSLMTEEAFIGWMILGALIMIFVIAYMVILKVAFPYYSDKKCNYIQKCRKEQKKK